MTWPVILAIVAVVVGFASMALIRRLLARPAVRYSITPQPLQKTVLLPSTFGQTAPGRYAIDFGRTAFAALELSIPSPEPGRKVSVIMGEALTGQGSIDPAAGVSVRYHRAELILKANCHNYVVPVTEDDARLMPPNIGPVMPFRYVEIENGPRDLKAEQVRQTMAHYPFDDSAASFECADQRLNAIWELCKYTMKATSFAGVFVDGDRERLPYEGDAYINQLGWNYCAGDYTLPRYSHEYLIQHPTWPTEWIMFSVLMAWEDYLFSGDSKSLALFYEDLKAKTLIMLARPDGLLGAPPRRLPLKVRRAIHIRKIRDVVDWPPAERDGCEMLPVNTVVNAFHAYALDRMSRIASALGNGTDEKNFHAAAQRTALALNQKLFDLSSGLYVDGEGSRHSSLHANMFPLAFGLVPLERRDRVTSFIRSRGMACSVYGAQFLMDALFDGDEADHALSLMVAPGDRSWRHMTEDLGATITLENWDNKYKPKQDWNHAWGAAPANVLPRKLMGVTPAAPGFSKVLIQPRPGSLAWAQSRTPTVHGTIAVRFENEAAFRLIVEIPSNVEARVGLPLSSAGHSRAGSALTLNGQPVVGIEAGRAVFLDRLSGGRHEIVLAPAA